jgi:hypothetical protein
MPVPLVGLAIGTAAKIAAKKLATKTVKKTAQKATKAAAKTTKNLPKSPTVKNPPKVPGINNPPQSTQSKIIESMKIRDAQNKTQRAQWVEEDRRRLAQMATDRSVNKPKPIKRGPFSDGLASYNWTGK